MAEIESSTVTAFSPTGNCFQTSNVNCRHLEENLCRYMLNTHHLNWHTEQLEFSFMTISDHSNNDRDYTLKPPYALKIEI